MLNLKHVIVFMAVVIGIIAYFILSHKAASFHKARLFRSLIFLIAGVIIVYIIEKNSDEIRRCTKKYFKKLPNRKKRSKS